MEFGLAVCGKQYIYLLIFKFYVHGVKMYNINVENIFVY